MAAPSEDPNKILTETIDTVETLKEAFNNLSALINTQLNKSLIDADNYTKQYVKSLRSDATSALNDLGKKSEKIVENQFKLQKGQITSKDISKQIDDLELRRLKTHGKITSAIRSGAISAEEGRKIYLKVAEAILEGKNALEAQNIEAKKLDANLEATKARMEGIDKIANNFSKIPLLGSLIDTGKMSAAMKKAAEENRSIFAAGFKEISKNITSALLNPVSIIKFFLDAAFKANKQSVELGKSLGYGAANSDRVRENFVRMEHSSDNINVNTANLAEASNQLTEATGYTAEYSQDALETQIMLTKQLGLSNDEAAGIYQFSVLQGKSSEATYQSMLKGYTATRNSLKTSVPFKAAMAEAAKVTGQLASNLGNNPKKIIEAVVATRALGTSLEQAKSQGEKLLDFQTSIESELKAELITGEQLNLERARAAALMGDQVTVANELAAQGMTSRKFSTMNVLAQKAYAEALGTTTDELANQLKKREIAISQGKTLSQVAKEEADEAAKRQAIQDKFNIAMDKIKSIIGNLIAGPLGSFIESLSKGLEYVVKMVSAFGKIGSAIKGFLGDKIGGALGNAASVATIGTLIYLVGRSMLKGTYLNPTVVTVAGGGSLTGNNTPGVPGGKLTSIIKTAGKAAAVGAALDVVSGLGENLSDKKQTTGDAIHNTVQSKKYALLGASFGAGLGSVFAGVGAVPGAGLGYAVGSIADMFSTPEPIQQSAGQQVEDGIATSGGPFRIKNKYGQTAITKAGDKLAVSPNINNSTPMDLSPMIDAINQVTAAVNKLEHKSWSVNLDSKAVGTGLMQKTYRSA